MQRGLIDHGARQQRVAIVFQRDRQARKPVCPLLAQMALEPNLIDDFVKRLGGVFAGHCLYLLEGSSELPAPCTDNILRLWGAV